MEERRRFTAEITELGKIDYFLDQLARAVERGEVHRASYDALAPRYLTRRAELIAIVSGANRIAAAPAPVLATDGSPAPAAGTVVGPGTAGVAGRAPMPGAASATTPSAASAPAAMQVMPRTASRPVQWTTVLLFLGAFLVIVASAIFAVAVWDLLGATGKLAFLGTLTAGFYGAGWWARTRLETPAGGTVLTAVASAMLLFDGWIAIDGYGLEGPLPWAVLLLVCSAVYWFTEVALAGRFFGVIGAAAQLGWWWLLGDGLGLPVPIRLGGMALVAVAWQLAAEHGREAPAVRSLSTVLRVAAPVVAVLTAVGMIADVALVRSAGLTEVVAAAVISCAAGWILARLDEVVTSRYVPAALAQLPFAVTVAVAMITTGHSWALIAVLLVASVAYGAFAVFVAGAPFAVLGLIAELGLVLELGWVLQWDGATQAVASAVLASTWAVASRLARRLDASGDAPRGSGAVGTVAEMGAFALLAGSSLVLLVPLLSVGGSGAVVADVLQTLAVLAAWLVAALVTRTGAFLVPAVVWSWVPVGVAVFAVADAGSVTASAALVVTAAGWLAVSGLLKRPFGGDWRDTVRWVARAGMVFFAFAGLLSDPAEAWGTWSAVALALGTAVLFALDAGLLRSSPSAAAAGTFAVLGAGLAAGTPPAAGPERFGVTGAASALLIAASGAALSRFVRRYGGVAAVAACVAGSATALAAVAEPGLFALSVLMLTAAWACATWAAGQPFAFVAGLAAVASALATSRWLALPPLATAGLTGGATLALVGVSLAGRSSDVRFPVRSAGLMLAGLLGQAGLIALGVLAGLIAPSGAWWAVSGHALAMSTALLGMSLLAAAWRYQLEAATYAGWFAVLVSVWMELGIWDFDSAELFSTSLALYLVAMGHLAARAHSQRPYPTALDAAAVIVGLGVPLRLSLIAFPPADSLVHAAWAIGLSLVAIAAGIVAKVRWYFFGGVAALAGIALYRSFSVLVEVWWLVLFVIGIALLVVALTWERQRVVVSGTRERLRRSFEEWR